MAFLTHRSSLCTPLCLLISLVFTSELAQSLRSFRRHRDPTSTSMSVAQLHQEQQDEASDCQSAYEVSMLEGALPAGAQEMPTWPHAAWLECERNQDFEHRPDRSTWQQRLVENIEAARADPCNADIVITAGSFGNGVGARAQNMANELWLAAYGKNSIAVCMEMEFMSNIWARWFTNKLGIASCDSGCAQRHPGFQGAWHHSENAARDLVRLDHDYVQDLKRQLVPQMFTFNADTLETINEGLVASGLAADLHYIGVHIRHGDKFIEAPPVPVEQYAEKVKGLLAERNISTVFVASDDPSAKSKMEAALGDQVRVLSQTPQAENSYAWRTDRTGDDPAVQASAITLFTDIEALRRADVFVGTGSSSVGRLIYYLRPAEAPSVSLDDEFWMLGA